MEAGFVPVNDQVSQLLFCRLSYQILLLLCSFYFSKYLVLVLNNDVFVP